MSKGLTFSKGGGNKNYIFKDGVFKITPTANQGTIGTDGIYSLSDQRTLSIPYVATDEIFYIRFKRFNAYYNGLSNGTDYVSGGGSNNPAYNYILGMNTSSIISITPKFGSVSYKYCEIREIWTEKIGGV